MSGAIIPYGKQLVDEEDRKAVLDVLLSSHLTQGEQIGLFEKAICELTGARYCVAVSSGTAALHVAVLATGHKAGKGLTSANTFVASSNSLIFAGLEPELIDIELSTFNMDIDKLVERVDENVKVVIPVHFAGQAVDVEKLSLAVSSKGVSVIEDASHAIGSSYDCGEKVGSCKYSDMTTFSFHPVKTITTGEGGAVTTNNKELYERLLLFRNHGITKEGLDCSDPWYYEMRELGFNYRMTDIQAALGTSQLKKIKSFAEKRSEIYLYYNEYFSNIENIVTPNFNGKSCYHLYVVLIDFEKIALSRKELMDKLREQGILTQVHYIPVYRHPYYAAILEPGVIRRYPYAEEYYQSCLTLPLFPGMSKADVDLITSTIKNIIN
jgi:perosamine synthetase